MHHRTQGFTLIELLIVIAIISLLAAVLVPSMIQARKTAVNNDALTYARNAVTLGEIYRSQYGNLGNTPADCTTALGIVVSQNVQQCRIRQDENATYVSVRSKAGNYYYFDGSSLTNMIATAPPGF